MSHRHNIDPQIRGFIFAESGDDAFDGATIERPKKTIQAAINAAMALDPPPNPLSPISQVSAAQGGTFTESFTLFDFIQFDASNTFLILDDLIGVTLASFLAFEIEFISNSRMGGTCFEVDGLESMGVNSRSIRVDGQNGIGFNVTGVCDKIFLNTNLLDIRGEGAIGYKIDSTTQLPIDINIDTVSLQGDNSTFMDYDPVNSSDSCVVNVSTVNTVGASGTTGFIARNGTLIVVQQGILKAGTAVHVKDGAVMRLSCDNLIGDVIVDEGGTLIASVGIFSGTVTNNGTILPDEQRHTVLLASSFSVQPPLPDTLALDTPLQLEFGAAQKGALDPVQIAADGTITINQTGQYFFDAVFQYGRSGAGQASWLFFRTLIDGVQEGNSIFAKIDNENNDTPLQLSGFLDVIKGQEITIEMVRDSQGFNSGSLMSDTPTLNDWNPSSSATIRISHIFPLEV